MRLLVLFCLLSTFSYSVYGMEVAAFRGVHQPVKESVIVDNQTCTAKHIADVNHSYLENTIEGIQASFDMGATVGHINIHRTVDNKIVVFHDWTLGCRTNGSGQTNQMSFAYLRSLDIGYGYTKYDSDGESYFPFRGYPQPMPSIEEVLDAFPNKTFIVYPKDKSKETIQALAGVLKVRSKDDLKRIKFLGHQLKEVRKLIPSISIFNSEENIIKCAHWYLEYGSSLDINQICKETYLAFPVEDFKKTLKGREKKFLSDMHSVGTKVWLIQVNTIEDLMYIKSELPEIDGIGTYRMDRISPEL